MEESVVSVKRGPYVPVSSIAHAWWRTIVDLIKGGFDGFAIVYIQKDLVIWHRATCKDSLSDMCKATFALTHSLQEEFEKSVKEAK